MATAIILGATGLVGSELLSLLLDNNDFTEVRAVLRRTTGIQHPRLREIIVDFDQLENWAEEIRGEVLFSAFGTTLKKAGSKDAQYRIDYTYQYQVAEIAARNGTKEYVLVSAPGADPESWIFYNQLKGELDRDVQLLPFEHLHLIRPSVLEGERNEDRMGEEFGVQIGKLFQWVPFLKKYRPVPGSVVAEAMLAAYYREKQGRVSIYEWGEVFELAGR